MENNVEYKGKIAFFYRNSWYHRKKEMRENGKIKYGKLGGFKTPEEAEESYYKCLEKFNEDSKKFVAPIINKEILLKDYLIYWYEKVYSKRVETTTSMLASYTVYNLIIPNLPYEIKVRLTTSDFLNDTLERIDKLGNSTANKSREILSLVFKSAIIDNILNVNPIDGTNVYRRKKSKISLLSKKEIKILLEKAYNTSWYLEILLGLFCGLRKGEIRGLKFTDFNSKNRTITIERQLGKNYVLEEYGYKILDTTENERDPKTSNSFRIIKAPTIIWDELEKRKKVVKCYKEKDKKFIDEGYVSCQPNGKPHAEPSLNTCLTRLCKNNLLPHITVHGLRHIYATILIEQNVPIARISALLGHSSIHTTFDIYCDVISEREKITAFINNEFVVEGNES